jgi:hypothetical protein
MLIVDELCACGALADYREEVDRVIKLAGDYGFIVATRSDIPQSSTDWTRKCIHLAIGVGVEKGLPLLWDLLHEIGHVVDGFPPHNELTLDELIIRESQAWTNAWNLVRQKLPSLNRYRDQFNTHRDLCLDSYRKS